MHTQNFVNPHTSVHTQEVEASWDKEEGHKKGGSPGLLRQIKCGSNGEG